MESAPSVFICGTNWTEGRRIVSAVGRRHAGMKVVEDSGLAFASLRVVACGVRSGRIDDPPAFFSPGGGPNGDLKIGFGESLGEDFGEEGIVATVRALADVG